METENKNTHGGARAGAGRPKGSKDRVSVSSLLTTLEQKTAGQTYEELLIEDFLKARLNNDGQLVQKYHHLISNKVMNTLAAVEVSDSEATLASRQEAFKDALAALTGLNGTSAEDAK